MAVTREVIYLAGVEIACRADGYLPMSFLRAGGKTYKDLRRDFQRKGRISQLLKAQAARANLPVVATSEDFSVRGLLEVNAKTKNHFRGFLHPRAAFVLTHSWFLPEIANEVIDYLSRFLSGDLRLVQDLLSLSDARRGTRSFATITSSPDNGSITAAEHRAAHVACAVETVGAQRPRDPTTICLTSTVSKCPQTQDVLVRSEWIGQTGIIDRLWDALEDVQRHHALGDVLRSVYFIRRGETPEVKVGYSRDPMFRLSQLQCGNAIRLQMEHQVRTQHYRALERALHLHLTAKGIHLRGEWFRLPIGTEYSSIVDDALGQHEGERSDGDEGEGSP